jgi:hypothetical protein
VAPTAEAVAAAGGSRLGGEKKNGEASFPPGDGGSGSWKVGVGGPK